VDVIGQAASRAKSIASPESRSSYRSAKIALSACHRPVSARRVSSTYSDLSPYRFHRSVLAPTATRHVADATSGSRTAIHVQYEVQDLAGLLRARQPSVEEA